MVGESCKEKIHGRMHLLTNTEAKVAAYVLEHYEKVLSLNITELAECAGVSDASVVRFCRSVGYKGYQDFKVNAARDVLPPEKHFNPCLEKGDDVRTICKKIFTSEVNVLNHTLAGIDISVLEEAAKQISREKKLVLFGTGGSLLVAKDAQHKFMKIGVCPMVYDDMDLQLMTSSLMSEGEVALGISHSGSNYRVMSCLKNAKDNGAYTIALVGRGRTAMSKIADLSLYCASEETMFQSESVSTRIAQLAMIDVLVAVIAFGDYDKSYDAIQRTRRATSEYKM